MLATILVLAALPVWAAFPAVERSSAPIVVVYPEERSTLSGAAGQFIMGSVANAAGHFEINGQTVAVRPSGAFLSYFPVSAGSFTFHCELSTASGRAALDRTILVTAPPAALPAAPLAIDPDSLSPKADQELRGGDWLVTRMRASPGQTARFRVGRKPWQPMREANRALGLYEGSYQVLPAEVQEAAPVEFQLGTGWGDRRAKTSAKVSFSAASPLTAVMRGGALSTAAVRTAPDAGTLFIALGGMRLLTGARMGEDTQILLSGGQTGWIATKYLNFLPAGAAPPRANIDVISTKASEDGVSVNIGISDRIPFTIEELDLGRGLALHFHYAYLHTQWMVHDPNDALVDDIRFAQETTGGAVVTIRLRGGQELWGYQASYTGSGLKIDIRRPPRLAAAPDSPLAGLTVFLDPGHMPSLPGVLGALGTREMDVNYATAKDVEALLVKEKAKPVLSRSSPDDEVGLIDRPRLAVEKKADLFISLHNNALPDGSNPFARPHGFSVFYHHPHSLGLAREVHHAYQRLVPLTDESLRFGDLLVARLTAMPAIIVESAYMTYPEQEEMLLDARSRAKFAEAIVSGLRAYAEGLRRAQEPAAKKRKTR